MKKLLLPIAIASCILLSTNIVAQSTNASEGTDFWIAFMDNADTSRGAQTLSVFITARHVCTVTISNPNTGWSNTITATPSGINQCYIPTSQAYTTLSGIVEGKGIHVTSTDTITLYAITRGFPNQDYTNVLPTTILRSNYIVQTFPADRYPAVFSIVAAEDSVTVDVTLSGDTRDGHLAGDSYSIFLPSAGMCCQIESTVYSGIASDLSGTQVTARDHKRIALFHGDVCVYIPTQMQGQSCDHVVEQAMPTDYWGKDFVAVGSHAYLPDYVRITSMADSCLVHINGTLAATLNARQTYQYTMQTNTEIDHIQTSQPAEVYLYFASLNGIADGDPSMTTIPPIEQGISRMSFTSLNSGNIHTHSACIICRSASINSIAVDGASIASSLSPIANYPGYHYAHIPLTQGVHTILDSSDAGFVAYLYGTGTRESYGYTVGSAARILTQPKMLANGIDSRSLLDGVNICPGDSLELEARIENGSIQQVRWDFGDGTSNSYANPTTHNYAVTGTYHACAAIEYYADTMSAELLHDTLCVDVTLHPEYLFHTYDTCSASDLPYNPHGTPYSGSVVGDTIHWVTRSGCDSIEIYHLHVLAEVGLLVNGTDTRRLTDGIDVCQHDQVLFNVGISHPGTILSTLWHFDDDGNDNSGDTIFHTFDSVGDFQACVQVRFTDDSVSSAIRDSFICTDIHVRPTYHIDVYDTIEAYDLPYRFNGREYSHEVVSDLFHYYSIHGCDSIIDLHLHINYNSTEYYDTVVCDTLLPFYWHGFNFFQADTMRSVLYNSDGSITLAMHCLNTIQCQPSTLWVPNIFTPSLSQNNRFHISASEISEASVTIFNRWGLFVTKFDGLTGSWDGTKNGTPCIEGAYTYIITYRTAGIPDERKVKVGTVLLIR